MDSFSNKKKKEAHNLCIYLLLCYIYYTIILKKEKIGGKWGGRDMAQHKGAKTNNKTSMFTRWRCVKKDVFL